MQNSEHQPCKCRIYFYEVVLKIGLTGNIGSGKSTVAKVFQAMDIPVFSADYQARQCYFIPEVKEQITATFGPQSYLPDGGLNTKYLAAVAFKSKNSLQSLNAVIHPALRSRFISWCLSPSQRRSPYVIMEAAILFENHFEDLVDITVCVCAPEYQRVNRVALRDGLSEDEIMLRMQHQWQEEKICALSDYTIVNKDKKMILTEILTLHYYFLEQSKQA
ncbi:MAG: dephospho-CoA kinase [Bacteroidia bacterium]|nr:dephospho-CoA kinase [Bacteroidia bacterium]